MASLTRYPAIALLFVMTCGSGFAAINYPPMVGDTPDVVIGDAEGASAANIFVFPDAINLDFIGQDDNTSPSALIWSYSSPGGVYRINGAEPVNPAVDNLVNPPAAKRLDTQKDPLDETGPRTITFRDNLRSPLNEAGGVGPYSDRFGSTRSNPPTFIDSGVVMLYCSDGTTVSLENGRSIIVYTLDNGFDRLSGCVHDWPPDPRPPYGWSYVNYTQGNAVPSVTSSGLCITVGSAGDNDGAWTSPYGVVQLTPNSVWEVRLVVTTNQTNVYSMPLWTLVYDNIGTGKGHDEYGGEYFFLGNEGGANTPIGGPTGRYEYTCVLMPVAMQTPQFADSQEGYFNPRVDADNDMRISLRVLDVGTSYGAQYDAGMVCWDGLMIMKHGLSDMRVDETAYEVAQFVDPKVSPTSPAAWQMEVSGQGATTVYKNGAVSILPTTNWSQNTVIMFRPGDLNASIDYPFDPTQYRDNWPIEWVADRLYYIEFMLSSPSAFDEVNPPDMIRVGADTLTSELCGVNFAVPNTPDLSHGAYTELIYRGVSMPRTGTPQKYGCFFYTHSVSRTTITDGARWRPRFEILTSSTLQPMGRATNLGGITVNSMTVKRVHFSK
ncbi:hypothetical protein LLG95_18180 [bacterium]|nr:hypothetical protein [bacterium]